MSKQKLGDRLTRILEGAAGAADRAIAHADKMQTAAKTVRSEAVAEASEAITQIVNLRGEMNKVVLDAITANDTWYEFHVRPLQAALVEAQTSLALANAEVISIAKALVDLADHRDAARKSIAQTETDVVARLTQTEKRVETKVEAVATAEAHLDAAAAECRKAGGSVKDALGNLQRAAAQQKRPPALAVDDGMSAALVEMIAGLPSDAVVVDRVPIDDLEEQDAIGPSREVTP